MRPTFLYLDMDGVLVDFVRGSIDLHQLPVDPENCDWDYYTPRIGHQEFWAPMGREFWANLEWTPDGREVFDLVRRYFPENHIFLLTSPCTTPGCSDGKRDWVYKHLGKDFLKRTAIFSSKYGLAGPERALIDDYDENIDSFTAYAGHGILMPRSWNRHREHQHRAVEHVARHLDTLMV